MRKDDEDAEVISWIMEHASIEEFDDLNFRQALFDGVNKRDSSRRFEIHNTDLIYCLKGSWVQKVIPVAFGEEEHAKIFLWISRKGIELGVVDVLKSLLPGVRTQRLVKIGRSKGSVDLDAQGNFYEITTKMFFGSQRNPRVHPPPDKVLQLISYLSAENKPEGNIKVYILLPSKEEVLSGNVPELPNLKKDIKRYERTWRVVLKDDFFKRLFEDRSELFYQSLITGDWSLLPSEPYLKWKCNYCSIKCNGKKMTVCEYINSHPDEVRKAWLLWNEDRRRHVLHKWVGKMSRVDRLRASFKKSYGREPTEQELDTFTEYIHSLGYY